jgi:TetR/AcrR family transcriptional regulator
MVNTHESFVETTQEKILHAARHVFLSKGMEGARMQEIADLAGINKALLHYYFRDKATLFHAVFMEAVRQLFPALTGVFRSDKPLLVKIPAFFEVHMGFIKENPLVPQFIISEVTRNPDMILQGFKVIEEEGLMKKFSDDVRASIAAGEIKPVEPIQLIINLLSLSVFPFLARPLISSMMGMDQSRYDQILEDRRTEVAKFVISALK